MKKILIALILFVGLIQNGFSIGSRMAAQFDGASTKNAYLTIDSSIVNNELNKDFTIECWINLTTRNGDPSIISNKDWNHGYNVGFVLAVYSDTQIKFNFTTRTGTRKDLTIGVPNLIGNWNHIAVTVGRKDSIKMYLNGKFIAGMATGTNGTAPLGASYPLNIAEDGTGAYSQGKFIGKLDEIRIWNQIQSATDISKNMCLSLPSKTSGLSAYYRLDETSGTKAIDATGNGYDAKYVNKVVSITSGAYLGDSVLISNSSTGLKYNVNKLGAVEVRNATTSKSDNYYFIQVLEKPSVLTGTSAMDTTLPHFALFWGGRKSISYDLKWSYNNYTKSIASKSKLLLFQRGGNDDSSWTSNSANTKDTVNKFITINSWASSSEFYLGNFTVTPCNTPSKIDTVSLDVTSAILTFKSGGSSLVNLQYGASGFKIGAGSVIRGINSSSNYTLSGLANNTKYDVYIQDTCVGSGTSGWFGPYTLTTKSKVKFSKPGSGTTLSYTKTGKEYVSMGKNSAFKLKKNMTLEMWVKMDSKADWDGLACYAQDNLYNESGYYMSYYNGKIRFFIKTASIGGNGWNSNPGSDITLGEWNHVAGTYDGDTIKFYLNGILTEKKAAAGDINWTYAPLDFRVGTYIDNDEVDYSDASIDELRLWNIARTQDQIRTAMCKKLTGTESGLVAYYNFDEGSGKVVNDLSSNALNGTATNTSSTNWVNSGAAVGDISNYAYPSSWTGKTVKLSTTSNGNATIGSISNTGVGIQLYQVNDRPNTNNGLTDTGYSTPYFGVFTCGDKTTNYTITYDYSGYSYATSNNNYLNIYNRQNNGSIYWNNLSGTNDKTNKNVTKTSASGQKEFVLNGFTPSKCPGPDSITYNFKGINTVISWKSTASLHNIQFGKKGFNLGNGTKISSISPNKYMLTGLNFNTSYEVYVQDSCGSTNGNSPWIGPLKFTSPNSCLSPDSVWVDTIGTGSVLVHWKSSSVSKKYQIIYGAKGFDPTFGFLKAGTNGKFALNGLTKNTDYDVYVRTNCDSGYSNYYGPVSFKTLLNTGIEEQIGQGISDFNIYPNPANDYIIVNAIANNKFTTKMNILDLSGKVLSTNLFKGEVISSKIDVSNLPKGMYIIQLENNGSKNLLKFCK